MASPKVKAEPPTVSPKVKRELPMASPKVKAEPPMPGRRSSGRLAALARSNTASPSPSAQTPAQRAQPTPTPTVPLPSAAAPVASSSSSATGITSEDELSTPLTTQSSTPVSFQSMAGDSKPLGGFRPASSLLKMEIELPDRPAPTLSAAGSSSAAAVAADSAKALSQSKYSLSAKRKRTVVDDSDELDGDEDEDEEEDYKDALARQINLERDVALARRLQQEEDTVHGSTSATIKSSPKKPKRGALDDEDKGWLGSDSDSSGPLELIPLDAFASTGAAKRRKLNKPFKLEDIPKKEEPAPSDDDLSSVPYDDDEDDDAWEDADDYMSGDEAAAILAQNGGADGNELDTRRQYRTYRSQKRVKNDRERLEDEHPVLKTMWKDLEDTPVLTAGRAQQPPKISRMLKPFQLEGLAWMVAMEKTQWKGGLLGDEMGLGKTIQAVSLIMSDYPASKPTLVLVPPVALMQWTSEIASYTDGCLKTFIYHSTNAKTKGMTVKDLKKYDVILMSYNSLESAFRKQEKGFSRKDGVYKEKSVIHQTHFHRVILDEAHCIKTRSTMTAKACFGLKVDYRWCLTGTPLQNRIGEFFSLLRFLQIQPFCNYICRDCKCSKMEWSVDESNHCTKCRHRGMRHLSVFNQELLNPIQRYGNWGPGQDAFRKLRVLTDRVMLRRLKKDHTDSMELPVKDIVVDRQFFSEVEVDFADSIMTNSERKFTTYVENRVMLKNYANIFGLIMQMRQVADHPDLILRKNAEGSQNVLVCCICDEPAEEAIRSRCKHDFCRECAKNYVRATQQPDCPRCHILLSIDLEQPEMEQDEMLVKKSSIINRIRMDNWTSSSKIELLVHNLYQLRSDKASHKSIIFSQFTTMLQLIEWRLRRAGITTVMLDGSMTPAQRQASIEHFKKNVDVECFLVSLKAGGVALNLTEASRVFIVDPWWNPAAEWQSADRCHRIGQTRPCVVTRLCIEDSVESRMVLLQEKKTRMINSTINSDDAAMESLTPEDLQFLFRGN